MRGSFNILVVVGLLASGACNDSAKEGIPDLSGMPSFAITLGASESSGVALLDGDGKILEKKYISSGSALAGLNSALHGDIALPTQPCEEGVLTVVARYGGDYVLQVDLENSKVLGQISTQGKSGGAAYSSNPQDTLCFGDGTALVSRFEPASDPSANDLDKGNDLVRIDLDEKKLVSRIDFSKLNGKATGLDADMKEEEQVAYARPGSIVRSGSFAFVGLSRLTPSFSAAAGMIAVVDLDTNKVEGFDLPKLRNCGSLTPVAEREDAVIVSCAGYPYGDRASAGLALVSIDDNGKADVEEVFQSKKSLPVIYGNPVSIGGSRAVAVASDYTTMRDEVYVVDLATGAADKLFSAPQKNYLGIGSGAFRADTGLLLIPDASEGVRLFKVTDSAVKATETLAFDLKLPPQSIRPIVEL